MFIEVAMKCACVRRGEGVQGGNLVAIIVSHIPIILS